MWHAIRNGNEEAIRRMAKTNPDWNTDLTLNGIITPSVCLAAQCNDFTVWKTLIELGADRNAETGLGQNSLHSSVAAHGRSLSECVHSVVPCTGAGDNHSDYLRFLINILLSDVAYDKVDSSGFTPTDYALMANCADTLNIFRRFEGLLLQKQRSKLLRLDHKLLFVKSPILKGLLSVDECVNATIMEFLGSSRQQMHLLYPKDIARYITFNGFSFLNTII
eukprot:Filipodium_phascolosomae@DN2385_c0_g1_i5.p1